MKTLAEFLQIEEGVEFKVDNQKRNYKIENNLLLIREAGVIWAESVLPINDLLRANIVPITRQILTDGEREYLNAVIKPFKKRIKWICKNYLSYSIEFGSVEYLTIYFKDSIPTSLPAFKPDEYYKGMKLNKDYTLADLGLDN